ncbi:PLP-dependent transferase [Byssothecium circinans]|uniref:PLP-dependent transferase n=1 Tax=Byssothecium circinans TaxID=147558 RepID=A0A6A5TDH6_9PLEO|nr:PLP-dependent transferase [Byssothecium circinans]
MSNMIADPDTFTTLSTSISELTTSPPPFQVLPPSSALTHARASLRRTLPTTGLGLQETIRHLREDIGPGLPASSQSPNYYGFVTGGSTPAAALADNLVTAYDQNAHVHLPKESVSANVEDTALSMLCELLKLDPEQWPHRLFTTGATASNIIGLACGREYIIREATAHTSDAVNSVGELGIVEAMHRANIDKLQILTTVPHSSLLKAAGILGLGRASVKDVSLATSPRKFDIPQLKKLLERQGTASIIAVSASEVNTGLFATSGLQEMQELRNLADMYGAWIHVDGAFGIMGRILTSPAHQSIIDACAGLELADSITGDGHKLLNVPYDCGFFYSKHRNIAPCVFGNPNAAYLSTGPATDDIMSPLNIGLENSRRFRALPVYASLTAYGSDGYRDMLERQIALSRAVAGYLEDSDDLELLAKVGNTREEVISNVYIIVLFGAKDDALNQELVERINATKKIYVSGTAWEGKPACRFAVSNWRADISKDFGIITGVLEGVMKGWEG